MGHPSRIACAAAAAIALGAAVGAFAQRRDAFSASREHPAIAYAARDGHNPVSRLNEALAAGRTTLSFERDGGRGYLLSVLGALQIGVESQTLVFSETSRQAKNINPAHPRAIYFNDRVAVGWVPGTEQLEVAAQDAEQGVSFYTLTQTPSATPQFTRHIDCLLCHLSWDTLAVPGLTTLSTFPMSDDPNAYASGVVVDHRTPIAERWGGWYVTGRLVPAMHVGNAPVIRPAASLSNTPPPPKLETVAGRLATPDVYPTGSSDVAALMVLNHQTHATNLLTWVGWETRVALAGGTPMDRVDDAVRELVDYFLFVDEAPIGSPIAGASSFAGKFEALGPHDHAGRSLRQLDLRSRLLRYPCSYMIYNEAFDVLPVEARDRIYARMARILSGKETDHRYARLSADDRQAVIEILRATKGGLPESFRTH